MSRNFYGRQSALFIATGVRARYVHRFSWAIERPVGAVQTFSRGSNEVARPIPGIKNDLRHLQETDSDSQHYIATSVSLPSTIVAVRDITFVNDEGATIWCPAPVQDFGSDNVAIFVANNSNLSLDYVRSCHCVVPFFLVVVAIDS